MTKRIDYYFAVISPWAYLGSIRLEEIARRHGAELNVLPVDYGRIFPASGGVPLAKRATQRQAYRLVELQRWRDYLAMPLTLRPKHFPTAESLAARMLVAARLAGHDAVRLAHSFMRGVWVEERDIADPATLLAIAAACHLDGAALLAAAEGDAAKATYSADTDAAIALGIFGAPSYVFNDEIFWGQDRLEFLERALAAA